MFFIPFGCYVPALPSAKPISPLLKNDSFKIAKCLLSICTNCEPFTLFHELLCNSSLKTRKPQLWLDWPSVAFQPSSTCKIDFDWLGIKMSKDTLGLRPKQCFSLISGLVYIKLSVTAGSGLFFPGWGAFLY